MQMIPYPEGFVLHTTQSHPVLFPIFPFHYLKQPTNYDFPPLTTNTGLNLIPPAEDWPTQITRETTCAMNIEQRSGSGTPRAPLDHARCWRELEGRLSTWLRTSLPIRASIRHVDMASLSSSRKGIDTRDYHRVEVGRRHSSCVA